MRGIIIPLNAFNRMDVLSKGQEWFVDKVAQSGAYGIEIRRELFSEGDFPLESIKREIEKYHLFTVYSAPIELWAEDSTLNKEVLRSIFFEAKKIGASWVKTSLGHYQEGVSSCSELKGMLTTLSEDHGNIQLLVENDQTIYGGNVDRLTSFFNRADKENVDVKMTFDTGNWFYTNQDIEKALEKLTSYVCYLHVKHVEMHSLGLVTLPLPNDSKSKWRNIINHFPAEMVKALEFPMRIEELETFINMVENATIEESERLLCTES